MLKKLLFLTAVLAMSLMPLASCSKDEPTPMDEAKKNVANTVWIGSDNHIGASTLTFNADGTFVIDVDDYKYRPFSKGTYNQDGINITFNVTSKWFFTYDYTAGTISYSGGIMEIPMYYYDGEYAYTAKYILKVSK